MLKTWVNYKSTITEKIEILKKNYLSNTVLNDGQALL